MRKNRKVSRQMSVMATNSMRFGAIIVLFFVMVILNFLSSSSCKHLLNTKGEMEVELAKLEKLKSQEATRWEKLMSSEELERAIRRRGLKMALPRPDQFVRLRADGTPYPGQPSVARARQRTENVTAMNGRHKSVQRRKIR